MNRQSCARGVFHVRGRQLTKQLRVLWYCVASARLGSQSLLQRGLFLMLQVLGCLQSAGGLLCDNLTATNSMQGT